MSRFVFYFPNDAQECKENACTQINVATCSPRVVPQFDEDGDLLLPRPQSQRETQRHSNVVLHIGT